MTRRVIQATMDPPVPEINESSRSETEQQAPVAKQRRSGRFTGNSLVVNAARVAALVIWLVSWQLAADNAWVNPAFSGSPLGTVTALRDFAASGELVTQLWATLSATLTAFVIGTVAGTLVGLLLGLSPTVDRIASPFLVPLNSIPRIALAPLFIVWFGLTMSAKVWLAISIVFFVLLFNARASVKTVEPDLMMLGRSLGYGKLRMLRKIVLPSAVPGIFAGVRLSITYSLLGVIASEMIAAQNGLGQNIVYFSSTFQVNGVFAVLIVLAATATAASMLVERAENWLLRWQRP